MPVSSRRQQGGLGPFAQQMALYSLAPLATEVVGNLLGNIVPGLVGQGGAGAFDLPGNSRMIGLPNHLPPNTYYQLPRPSQKGGLVRKKKAKRVGAKKKGKGRSQKGGLGPLAVMAGLSLAPMLLNSLMPQQQRRMPPQHRMPPRCL